MFHIYPLYTCMYMFIYIYIKEYTGIPNYILLNSYSICPGILRKSKQALQNSRYIEPEIPIYRDLLGNSYKNVRIPIGPDCNPCIYLYIPSGVEPVANPKVKYELIKLKLIAYLICSTTHLDISS